MKTVVTLVVTLVYCFPWSSFCVSSAQDINDGDEDVSSTSSLVKSMGVLLLSGFLEAEELLKMVKRWLKLTLCLPSPRFCLLCFLLCFFCSSVVPDIYRPENDLAPPRVHHALLG
ncbi:hypothetical protein NC651_006698 [Populus alba x Populus x berolinensis]|nr:hypothetical protein NC651_006698 [Populus alba x Populus x berolinensis]